MTVDETQVERLLAGAPDRDELVALLAPLFTHEDLTATQAA